MIGWPSMQITFSLNFSLFSLMLTGQSNWNLVHVTTWRHASTLIMHQWPHRPQAHSRHDRCHKEKGYEILIQNPSHQLAILEEQTARSAVHESEISSGTGNNHQNTWQKHSISPPQLYSCWFSLGVNGTGSPSSCPAVWIQRGCKLGL
jgi:hypothetical protein